MKRSEREIKYYAITGKTPKGFEQIIVTVKNTKLVSQIPTGHYYKTIEEANRDMFMLNCAGKIVG